MKKVLVLGAGHSAPFLVHYLLENSSQLDIGVTVADARIEAAEAAVGGHSRGRAIRLDITHDEDRRREIGLADVVVHLLPPKFQPLIAEDCVAHGAHMVSASYCSKGVAELRDEAERRGLVLLCELGLDPGMDLMSASATTARIHADGGVIDSCFSYGGGLPDHRAESNPLRYFVTWNPRNVVMAGESGAEYMKNGRIRLLPWQRLFATTWAVDVPGIGVLEAHANRDSLSYRGTLGLDQAKTLVRGTLRYPGWGALWEQIVRLGLPNEQLEIPQLAACSYRELVEMFLPEADGDIRERVADYLALDRDGEILAKLDWLGLFSDEPIGPVVGDSPAAALQALLSRRLALPPGARDMVVLHHEFGVIYPASGRSERILSTFIEYGEPGRFTAMAKSVGLTAALGVEWLLTVDSRPRGVLLPTQPQIYQPLLSKLERLGMGFKERTLDPATARF